MKTCDLCSINDTRVSCYVANVNCNARATCVLSCGHEAKWMCGKDADPRTDAHFTCRACLLPRWRHAVDDTPDEARGSQFLRSVHEHIQSSLIQCKLLDEQNFTSQTVVKPFITARKKILKTYLDYVVSHETVSILEPPSPFGFIDGMANYHIVFLQLKYKDEKTKKVIIDDEKSLKAINQRFVNRDGTIMGQGIKLALFQGGSTLERLSDEGGIVKLCLGVAFAHREDPRNEPFRTSNAAKDKKNSNSKAILRMGDGYDFISIVPAHRTTKALAEHVYWEAGSVVPIGVYTLQVKSQCMICGDHFSRTEGFFCGARHFVCWKQCFEQYVKSASAPDAINRSVDAEGNLICPGCHDAYDPHRIALNGPPKALDALIGLKMKIQSEKRGKVITCTFCGLQYDLVVVCSERGSGRRVESVEARARAHSAVVDERPASALYLQGHHREHSLSALPPMQGCLR